MTHHDIKASPEELRTCATSIEHMAARRRAATGDWTNSLYATGRLNQEAQNQELAAQALRLVAELKENNL